MSLYLSEFIFGGDQSARSWSWKKSAEHHLGRMFSCLLNMCFSDWLTNTSSNILKSMTMHFKVRFIGEYNSFPQLCTPIFIFFSPLKSFSHHSGSQQLLLAGFSCDPPSIEESFSDSWWISYYPWHSLITVELPTGFPGCFNIDPESFYQHL